ncbi:ankyrin repeat-containing protein BDA1-like isoform X2 [Ziziphus jujuba]|uniref:Ankyrin repeat-containing protein BDA1-like isoform X2 n=1 Tax=Ziziphus jujuba TaxID=326968 RepID=A0ABM3ZY79_ZIZJJ|nr:ankyrin repeat-containing protein BDA1-like isoform X2 [Ziziphus jujuba]
MDITSHDQDETMRELYEASFQGSPGILDSLFQNDPLILNKISLTRHTETPLHISALLGHLNFTKKLLSLKPQGPKLAAELDLLQRVPLHLASAEGHTDIVRLLLQANEDMCLRKDRDGKIPLHYAAMRGRVDVIELLIGWQPRSVFEKLNEGETVLHLCVQYDQLEALKVLVVSLGNENNEFLNSQDEKFANTILHSAVMLKQIKTIEYLVSIPEVKRGASKLNRSGFTAFETIEQLPKDFKSIKILNILLDKLGLLPAPSPSSSSINISGKKSKESRAISSTSWWSKCQRYIGKYDGDWVKDRSGALMIVATVIATMTFQTAVNPPGGVWQQDTNTSIYSNSYCGNGGDDTCIAGTAVLVRYKPFMWLLNLAIVVNLTFMALTFLDGMYLVTPMTIDDWVWRCRTRLFYGWFGVIGIVFLLHTIRFVFWAVKKLYRKLKC